MTEETLLWDFFGPRAQPTAEHFLVHLVEFLNKNNFMHSDAKVIQESALHFVTFCTLNSSDAVKVAATLRPKRRVPLNSENT